MLGNALVELMLEKPFDDITVQNILDRADVGRSTFYDHYTDKEDLLLSEIARVIQQFAAEADQQHNELLPSLALFRHVQEERRLMQAFVWGRGAEMHTRNFQEKVNQIVEQNLRSMAKETDTYLVPLPVVANFVASTFLMLLRWWFDESMRHTPEQMDEMFQMLVMPAIQQVTGHPF